MLDMDGVCIGEILDVKPALHDGHDHSVILAVLVDPVDDGIIGVEGRRAEAGVDADTGKSLGTAQFQFFHHMGITGFHSGEGEERPRVFP